MSPALAQREVALAGVALLAAILALAVAPRRHHKATAIPPPVPVNGSWNSALAGARPFRYGRVTQCGVTLERTTRGVVDPVIPCNVKLYVRYRHGAKYLVQVIDKRPVVPGRRFDLTPALAEALGVHGIRRIKWVYAGTR